MAELQISGLTATATVFETEDYFAVDDSVENTRKMLASVVQSIIRGGVTAAQLTVLSGIAATLTAAELNILDGCTATATQLNYTKVTTPGTAEESKALVLDSDGDGGLGRNMNVSGTLGVAGVATMAAKAVCSLGLTVSGGNIDLVGNDLILDADGDSKLAENATADDVIDLWLGGASEYRWDAAAFGCSSVGGNSLGGELDSGSSLDAANSWNNLNMTGHISMGGIETPSNPAIDESMKLYFDSSDGGLKVLLRHGGVTKPFTLQAFA